MTERGWMNRRTRKKRRSAVDEERRNECPSPPSEGGRRARAHRAERGVVEVDWRLSLCLSFSSAPVSERRMTSRASPLIASCSQWMVIHRFVAPFSLRLFLSASHRLKCLSALPLRCQRRRPRQPPHQKEHAAVERTRGDSLTDRSLLGGGLPSIDVSSVKRRERPMMRRNRTFQRPRLRLFVCRGGWSSCRVDGSNSLLVAHRCCLPRVDTRASSCEESGG